METTRVVRAANLAWVAWPSGRPGAELDARLHRDGLTGTPLWGPPDTPLVGVTGRGGAFAARLRAARDPHDRFLEL